MPTITTSDGVQLHHTDDGDGRPVVLIAGFSAPAESWDDTWAYGFYGLTKENIGTFFAAGVPDTGRGRPGNRLEGFARLVDLLGAPPPFADPHTPPMRALLQDHAQQDWRDVVARMTVPALFLAGRDSQVWPCEHATASAALNPRATAMVLDDCGHAVNIDQPDATDTAILEFLR